ncbi:MAG: PEFG-CTERM sorting domain-containing protein [Nitrosopumilaceae archaeon]
MRIILIMFFVISVALVSTTPAFSQSEPFLSVETSESTYDEGDTIVISGKVSTLILDTPITIQVFFGTTLVEIAQLEVGQDGSFTHTILAEGPLWNSDGAYIVRASYGQGNVAEVSFDFVTEKGVPVTTNIFEVDAGNSGTFDVEYTIRGGVVVDMLVDSDIFALIVIIQSDDDGALTVELPRDSVDALKSDGNDDAFIILIDGVEVPYDEVSTSSKSRTITIEFEGGDSDIEIIGTFVVPEFGTIAAFILAVAIISTIIISRKNQLIRI